jgi:ribosomal protein S1
MSDMEKPTEATPPPPAEQPTAKPPREKSTKPLGKVPSLQHEQAYGFGKKIDAFDDDMERQLQEAMSGMSDKDLYGEPAQQARRGKATEPAGPKMGKVFRIHGQDVFIDLPGGRTQGVLPMLQFPEGPPALGTEIEITIEGFDSANGVMLLSRKGAAVEADWSSVAAGMTVEARVLETNKGGLAVDVNGIRGFMPISQIDLYRVENAEQFVNQRLLCIVTEVDPVERNLVVSRRALLEKQREEMRDKLWNELAEGQIREGVVRSVKDFGAFVDLGGVDGLLHVSEMSWQRVQDAATLVHPGDSIKVVVLKIDHERRKVGLGLKQLTASPWDNIGEKYHPGDLINGKVSRVMDFGAFVELEPAIEGLIHISELALQRVFRVGDIVKPGQEVQVKVLSVDPAQRRISLSLKAAQVKEPEPVEEEPEEEAQVAVKPSRPRTTPLRGGTGSGGGQLFSLPQPPSEEQGG